MFDIDKIDELYQNKFLKQIGHLSFQTEQKPKYSLKYGNYFDLRKVPKIESKVIENIVNKEKDEEDS